MVKPSFLNIILCKYIKMGSQAKVHMYVRRKAREWVSYRSNKIWRHTAKATWAYPPSKPSSSSHDLCLSSAENKKPLYNIYFHFKILYLIGFQSVSTSMRFKHPHATLLLDITKEDSEIHNYPITGRLQVVYSIIWVTNNDSISVAFIYNLYFSVSS